MKKHLKIGLFGMYGLYNYGCEAIVRGTYEILKQAWPSSEVILYTYCPKEDKDIINDIDINTKHVPMKKFILVRRVINKLLRILSIQYQLPIWNADVVADECDIIFSVGGDIYTIPKHILDNQNETRYSELVEFGKKILSKRPFVIWGASIGPFGNKKIVKNYYNNHLRQVKQIFCREEVSFNYLKDNNVNTNLQLCSDPAFYVKDNYNSKQFSKSNNTRIALNLSPLSIREQLGENYKLFNNQIIKVIEDLLSIKNSEVILVPHVISPFSESDNDLTYLKNIYNSINSDNVKNLRLIQNANGFLGTKQLLKTCDIVIAARMHCAINAVSEGVPTIFLTYSQKGLGMANYIYGNSNWAIPIMNIENDLKNKVIEMLSNHEIISKEIKKKINEIKNDEERIVTLFKQLI